MAPVLTTENLQYCSESLYFWNLFIHILNLKLLNTFLVGQKQRASKNEKEYKVHTGDSQLYLPAFDTWPTEWGGVL